LYNTNSVNANKLLNDPDLLLTDDYVAYASAIWFYMVPEYPDPSPHDVLMGHYKPNARDENSGIRTQSFATTTLLIAGKEECSMRWDPPKDAYGSLERAANFKVLIEAFGVKSGVKIDKGFTTCTNSDVYLKEFNEDSASANL